MTRRGIPVRPERDGGGGRREEWREGCRGREGRRKGGRREGGRGGEKGVGGGREGAAQTEQAN